MEFDGYVEGRNVGEGFQNIVIRNLKNENINLKVKENVLENIKNTYTYHFNVSKKIIKDKEIFLLDSYQLVYDYYDDWKKVYDILKTFYPSAKISAHLLDDEIQRYIALIQNEDLKKVVSEIYHINRKAILTYPAAVKYHHAYLSGMAYHIYNMLRMSDNFISIYKELDYDLVIAGIILHDVGKIYEYSEAVNAKKSINGELIGHLVKGSMMVMEIRNKYDLDQEKIDLLCHIILSHHGKLAYGSPKEPMIIEAILVAYLDDLDSKLTTVGEYLEKTEVSGLTSNIMVLEGLKVYKHR